MKMIAELNYSYFLKLGKKKNDILMVHLIVVELLLLLTVTF